MVHFFRISKFFACGGLKLSFYDILKLFRPKNMLFFIAFLDRTQKWTFLGAFPDKKKKIVTKKN